MLKIRASSLGKIMTDSKVKSDPLGATCRSALRDIWISQNYGRERDFSSAMIEKGNRNENKGITMLSNTLRTFLKKNTEHFQNDYFTGTPDVIDDGRVFDIKCSWSLHTFFDADITRDYEWQGRVYMELTGCKMFNLVYVLTDTPEKLIEQEVNKILYKSADTSLFDDINEAVKKQMTFGDIPIEKRIKIFNIQHDPELIEKAKAKIDLCREEYKIFTL